LILCRFPADDGDWSIHLDAPWWKAVKALGRKLYPFARRIAGQLPAHDDRMDFLAGIDLILTGIDSSKEASKRVCPD
jgi:hypothetical protein